MPPHGLTHPKRHLIHPVSSALMGSSQSTTTKKPQDFLQMCQDLQLKLSSHQGSSQLYYNILPHPYNAIYIASTLTPSPPSHKSDPKILGVKLGLPLQLLHLKTT